LTPEERTHGWTRVNYIMELVKNEGDAECERAFDFLLAERLLSIAEERAVATLEGGAQGWEACAVLLGSGVPESAIARIANENATELRRQAAAIRARV
jgi:hypothetical protein